MISRLLQLARESAVYGLSGISLRLVALVLVPIYVRVFSSAEYGVITVVTAVIGVATLFVGLGADASFSIHFNEREDLRSRSTIAKHYILLQVVTAGIMAALIIALAPRLATYFLGSATRAIYLRLAALTLFFSFSVAVQTNLLRMLRRPWSLVAFNGAMTVLQIGAAVVLVVALRWGLFGHFVAQLGVAVVFLVVSLWIMRDWLRTGEFSWRVLAGMVRLGLPFVFTTSSLAVIALADRFFLARFTSLDEVGRYNVANSLAALLGLATNAFQLALWPYVLSIRHEPDAEATIARILTAFLVPAAGLAVALSIFAREILGVVTTAAYMDAARVVPWLAFYIVSIALSYIAAAGIWLTKQTDHLAWTAAVGAAVNIGLNLLLIPRFGMLGAAIATLSAELIYVAAVFWASHLCHPIPYEWRSPSWIAAISVALVVLGAQADHQPAAWAVVLKLLVLGLYPMALIATGVVDVATLRRVAAQLRGDAGAGTGR